MKSALEVYVCDMRLIIIMIMIIIIIHRTNNNNTQDNIYSSVIYGSKPYARVHSGPLVGSRSVNLEARMKS